MEEDIIKDKDEGEKEPQPFIKPGEGGIKITPVSSTSSKPTTPLPRPPSFMPPPFPENPPIKGKGEKDITAIFLLLAVIFSIFSLWILISIGTDKIPGFLEKFF